MSALEAKAASQAVSLLHQAGGDPVQHATTLALMLTRISELAQIVEDTTLTVTEVGLLWRKPHRSQFEKKVVFLGRVFLPGS